MTIALIDNGSLEPAAHRGLRAAARALSERAGAPVEAVSWRHSDRIPAAALGGEPAHTLAPWVRALRSRGESRFVLVPFLVSPRGAIGSALRRDLDALSGETGGFACRLADGLAPAHLSEILASRIREALRALRKASVIVVDHGGPSRASAAIRDEVAASLREELGGEVRLLRAASMEGPDGPGFAFNKPLLHELLGEPGFDRGPVIIAPLFLSPGRHAGPDGDIARIAREAEARLPGLRCHVAGLVGTHPLAAGHLADSLRAVLSIP